MPASVPHRRRAWQPGATALRVVAALVLVAAWSTGVGAEERRATWTEPVVPFYVNPLNSDVSPDAALAAVQQAALTWSVETDARFAFVYAGATDATVSSYNLKNEVIFREATDDVAIATTYTWKVADVIVDADVIFWDEAYRFHTGESGCEAGFYIEDIAVHELGHAAGIPHLEADGATMSPLLDYCTTEARSLAADDVAALETLYPTRGGGRPAVAPANLLAAVVPQRSASAVSLTWEDHGVDATDFVIQRATDVTGQRQPEASGWTTVGQAPAGVLTFTDATLSPATTYWYRVRASAAGQAGPPSSVVQVTTLPGPGQPAAPTGPQPSTGLDGTSHSPVLSWHAVPSASSYDVYVGTVSPPPLLVEGQSGTSLALPTLRPGTTYHWRVVARNASGGSPAPPWEFTTYGAPETGGGGLKSTTAR